MSKQTLIFTNRIKEELPRLIGRVPHDRLFILTDRNTSAACLPLLSGCPEIDRASLLMIEPDDTHKNLETLVAVWQALSEQGATRKSLMINLGGGMVTDLGGFAASTFKRGIAFINVSTTLLGAVDAAVGGKTGINFNGLKNEIGVFNSAHSVLICTEFFKTLSRENLLSGFAEMLKHGLISSAETYDKLLAVVWKNPDPEALLLLLEESVLVKERIVEEDPFEKGMRKALNLGHTVGHAFESLSHARKAPVPHGYAVAWGLVCELILSHLVLKFPIERVRQLADYVYENYGSFEISCREYDCLYESMTHDKKNEQAGAVNFSLLAEVGEVRINQLADRKTIEVALDLYRDLFKL